MNISFINILRNSLPCAVAVLLSSNLMHAARSLSQYGITWTFSEDRPTGQFANGDWWIVGPVTITSITPAGTGLETTRAYNGSMVNVTPEQHQGLLEFTPPWSVGYNKDLNIALALPRLIESPCSIVSSIVSSSINLTNMDPGLPEKTTFREIAILTVLASVPPAGSFRPPYAGSDKTIKPNWKLTQLDYSVFRNIVAPNPANIPDRTYLENATVRPLFELISGYRNSDFKASQEGAYPRRAYGREISHISGLAGISLNLNAPNSAKEKLLINMCQWGIDIHGLINSGMSWPPNGGHQQGRKLPIFIAAKALGDAAMLEDCNANHFSGFQEDQGHFFVTQTDIDTPRYQVGITPYSQDMLGMPEWSSGGPTQRNQGGPDWYLTGYRFVNGGPNSTAVLCVSLMNGRADYGNDAYFRYMIERYYPTQLAIRDIGGENGLQQIVVDLWNRHLGVKPLTGLRIIK